MLQKGNSSREAAIDCGDGWVCSMQVMNFQAIIFSTLNISLRIVMGGIGIYTYAGALVAHKSKHVQQIKCGVYFIVTLGK